MQSLCTELVVLSHTVRVVPCLYVVFVYRANPVQGDCSVVSTVQHIFVYSRRMMFSVQMVLNSLMLESKETCTQMYLETCIQTYPTSCKVGPFCGGRFMY